MQIDKTLWQINIINLKTRKLQLQWKHYLTVNLFEKV